MTTTPSVSMTSSVTPTDEAEPARPAPDPDRRLRLAVIGAALVAGWGFILWAHNLRFAAPVFFLWLGWLAVVAGVHYLWRTGTATADPADEDAAWWRPTGAREELEREKRSLLKAIKEVEFDHQTGKMSEKDAQALTRVYRARAIEVIKAIDELVAAGETRSVRQQIDREVKARLAIEGQAKKGEAAAERKKRGKAGGKKADLKKTVDMKKPEAKHPDEKNIDADEKQANETKANETKAEDKQ